MTFSVNDLFMALRRHCIKIAAATFFSAVIGIVVGYIYANIVSPQSFSGADPLPDTILNNERSFYAQVSALEATCKNINIYISSMYGLLDYDTDLTYLSNLQNDFIVFWRSDLEVIKDYYSQHPTKLKEKDLTLLTLYSQEHTLIKEIEKIEAERLALAELPANIFFDPVNAEQANNNRSYGLSDSISVNDFINNILFLHGKKQELVQCHEYIEYLETASDAKIEQDGQNFQNMLDASANQLSIIKDKAYALAQNYARPNNLFFAAGYGLDRENPKEFAAQIVKGSNPDSFASRWVAMAAIFCIIGFAASCFWAVVRYGKMNSKQDS